jgi:hypothetical protein
MVGKNPSVARYREQVLTPLLWIRQADELVAASRKLEPSIRDYWIELGNNLKSAPNSAQPRFRPKRLLEGTYFMLVAYAIENYFKAVLVTEFKTEYGREIMLTGELPDPLKEHNLMTLARVAGLNLTETELSLLARLYRNSLWQGRFPVPVNAHQLSRVADHEGQAVVQLLFESSDISNLKALVRRIRKLASAGIPSSLKIT